MGQENDDARKDFIESRLVREDPSLADMVLEFVNGLEGRVRAMEKAVQEENLEALRRAAQQLKGSGDGYGYPILTERAAALERFAGTQSIAECRKALADLKQLCRRVVVRID